MAGWQLSLVAFAYATSVLHGLPTALVDGGDPTTCAALSSLNAPQLSSWCVKSCGSTPSICPPDLCECASLAKSAVAPATGADAPPPSGQTSSAAPASAPKTGDISAIAANTAALLAAAKRHISQRRTTNATERQPTGEEVASEATTEAASRPPAQNTSIVPVAFEGPSAARWARLNQAGTIELLSSVTTNVHPAAPPARAAAAVITVSEQTVANAPGRGGQTTASAAA